MRVTNKMIDNEWEAINSMLESSCVVVQHMNDKYYLVIHYTDGREHWSAGMTKRELYDFMVAMEYTIEIMKSGNISIYKEG